MCELWPRYRHNGWLCRGFCREHDSARPARYINTSDAFRHPALAQFVKNTLEPGRREWNLDFQAVKTAEQSLHMFFKSKNLSAVYRHCLKHTVPKKKAAVVDRHRGLCFRHKFA